MSQRERDGLKVLPEVQKGHLAQKQAAGQPGLSDRWVRNLLVRMGITHRRTAYRHPVGNSYIERFHQPLKEAEVGLADNGNLEGAPENMGR